MAKFGITYMPDFDIHKNAEVAKIVERSAADFIWIADETPTSPNRDAYVAMTYIATLTKRLKLGTGICNPYSRNPVMMMMQILTLDELSDGRTTLGLGAGGSFPLVPLGVKMWNKPIKAIRETITVARRLFAGETVNYDGEFVKARNVKPFYKPRNMIPIYLAGRGPQMVGLIGELADGSLISPPYLYLRTVIDQIKEGAKNAGRSIRDIDIGCTIPLAASKDEEEAIRMAQFSAAHRFIDSPPEVIKAVGLNPEDKDMIRKEVMNKGWHEGSKVTPRKLVEVFATAGTPEYCIKRAKEFERAGVTQLIFSLDSYSDMAQGARIICNEVIPHLKS